MIEQRQLTEEMVRQYREGCALLEAVSEREWDEGESDRYRQFCAIEEFDLVADRSAFRFRVQFRPLRPADMGPFMRFDWAVAPWRLTLIEASRCTPKTFKC
jgi:hypothetical protein